MKREKCSFFTSSVEYLGHTISAEGILPLRARVAAINNFPQPSTRGELQRFLGMINYYRRFIRGAASILKPLTDPTHGPGGCNKQVEWGNELHRAFGAAKAGLAKAAQFTHPRQDAQISLAVDASNHHVGGVLQQLEGGM